MSQFHAHSPSDELPATATADHFASQTVVPQEQGPVQEQVRVLARVRGLVQEQVRVLAQVRVLVQEQALA